MLGSQALHCFLGGGARSGKTFLLVRAIILRANMSPDSRHAIFRFRFNSLHASVIEQTFPDVMKKCWPGLYDQKCWNKTLWYYEFQNGAQVWFGGLDDKDRVEKILGQEYATIYFNECSQIPWNSITTARTRLAQKSYVMKKSGKQIARRLALKAYYDFNPPSKRHWTYQQAVEKRNPETKKPVNNPDDVSFMYMNPDDNWENLSPEFKKILEDLPPAGRKRFMLGEFADDTEGALWTEELIDQQRFIPRFDNPLPAFSRVVVAVDPSGGKGEEDERSDETGIVVVGLGTDGKGYVLEDLSGKYAPQEWSRVACSAYERHEADCIVAEVNYGGAMVEATIQANNPNIPFKGVHASRGKAVRAEPVSTLFDRGTMFVVGHLPELEDQLNSFTVAGYQGLKSPDRADAMVWGATELFPAMVNREERKEIWVPPKVNTSSRGMSRFDRG